MKGLMMKDLRLMISQKKMFIMFIAIGIFLIVADQNYTFAVSYTMFVSATFAMSTISYDTFDNGMSFLLTLPVSRKDYIYQKYGLVVLVTLVVDVIISACGVGILNTTGNGEVGELLLSSVLLFFIILLFYSVMLPVNIKYGTEKGRTVMFTFAGAIVVIVMCVQRFANVSEKMLEKGMNVLMQLGEIQIFAAIGIVGVLAIIISMYVSVGILKKKEY